MLQPQTHHFSKENQLQVIKEILRKYPTAKDFKVELKKSFNPKLKALADTINENMDRYQYVDFLQYVFVKYSGHGKFLSTILSSIGLGILGNYLGLYLSLDKNKIINTGLGALDDFINNNSSNIPKKIRNDAMGMASKGVLSGALAGGIGGGIVNGIWKWNDMNKQSEIEDLKQDSNKAINHVILNKKFTKFK